MKNADQSEASLLNREDCILIVIDMQKKLVPVISQADKAIENVIKLVKLAKILQLPIVLTEQQNLGETVDEIQAETKDIQPISKITFSCFGLEEFHSHIRQFNRKTLILSGIESHICVTQTALDAPAEYSIQVVSDAVASRAPHNWKIAIDRMQRGGATITSTEMLMYELLQKAGTDEFRAALPLVK
jgi:nicotinamidase-related amidase